MSAGSGAAAGSGRRLRADAQRNRDAILGAAREVFAEEGVLAPLDAIAVRAGVGNATLYRNFPTREDLLSAVMEAGIAEAVADGENLARTQEPGEALLQWLVHLAWLLRIWHDLPYCLADAHMDQSSPVAPSTAALVTQTQVLLEGAQAVGAARPDIAAGEIFELVTAVSWAVDRFGDDEQAARRRVLLATTGLVGGGPANEVPTRLG
ncbi:helix-turn-helix domain-containing protein [Streptomyces sp. NPDC005840]|uniref:Helix-turn-helix domain-containing protein n=1 Tax=Streptomyces doudnae TaxID=3075536 RepID=A0ABD5EL56_9ACTN|nr:MULTISPECIES: TetR/AcrR family transcriptional regulator [unclassified Streptomyces]MDT0435030.1 helix-turn-helix domain-containing protein [Streptomyces sp. DSM 41981]MYQ67797.1 TetR family transcriptional regulator [Streptomyces sp. SID4950]SCE40031.1 transcriptional regulator, TetR family [Streptomyces sp. SolWspMP-5a-2]